MLRGSLRALVPPLCCTQDMRAEMSLILESLGIPVEDHGGSEVGASAAIGDLGEARRILLAWHE